VGNPAMPMGAGIARAIEVRSTGRQRSRFWTLGRASRPVLGPEGKVAGA
jgi:hypothetical protein